MAELCFNDADITINSVNLSDHVKSVTINYSAEMLETTAMGEDSKTRIAGLKDYSVEVEFNQDYATSEVDATLFPLVGADSFAFSVKPTSESVSATNPNYNGNVLLESYSPIGGAVGELATVSVSFQGDGSLTRSTS